MKVKQTVMKNYFGTTDLTLGWACIPGRVITLVRIQVLLQFVKVHNPLGIGTNID